MRVDWAVCLKDPGAHRKVDALRLPTLVHPFRKQERCSGKPNRREGAQAMSEWTEMVSAEGEDLVVAKDVEAGIRRLILNAPERYNALSLAMIEALDAALRKAFADSEVRAIVLAAQGKGFCAGHDLKEIHAHRQDADGGRAFFVRLFDRCTEMMEAMREGPKIIIAEVQGVAAAAGAQLVASCDIVIAAETARFGVNGINAGLFCSTPMVPLSRDIGRKKALELLVTGRLMSATEAQTAGLVNHVVTSEALSEETLALARRVAAQSARVVALGKRAFYRQLEMSVEDAYAYTRGVIVENLMLEDAVEGICAFVEKREPKWRDG